LGVTLYFLLTGVVPFEGRSWGRLVYAHMTAPPVAPSLRVPDPIPPELEELVLRCLAKKPDERYQSAREVHAALEKCTVDPPWTNEDAKRFWTTRAALPR